MLKLSNLTLLLFIFHFVGDYHLQSETMVKEKSLSLKGLLQHGLVHFVLLFILWIFLTLEGEALSGLLLLVLFLVHLGLDYLKAKQESWTNLLPFRLKDWQLYLLDQVLHTLSIYLVGEVLLSPNLIGFEPLGISNFALRWILLILLITKPANVSFKTCFEKYQLIPFKQEGDSVFDRPEPGAGAMIGSLERILSALFLFQSQYAAIGLIYTAKSIARYKQIEENKRFAEYYLIGTLYSILYVLVAYHLLLAFGLWFFS